MLLWEGEKIGHCMLNDKKSKGVHKFLEILLGLMTSRGTPCLYQVSTAVVRCISFTMESLSFPYFELPEDIILTVLIRPKKFPTYYVYKNLQDVSP